MFQILYIMLLWINGPMVLFRPVRVLSLTAIECSAGPPLALMNGRVQSRPQMEGLHRRMSLNTERLLTDLWVVLSGSLCSARGNEINGRVLVVTQVIQCPGCGMLDSKRRRETFFFSNGEKRRHVNDICFEILNFAVVGGTSNKKKNSRHKVESLFCRKQYSPFSLWNSSLKSSLLWTLLHWH